jgi:hypothetical protein
MTRQSSKLLIDESPLQVLPSLACLLGGAEPAIVLQQVHYWVGITKKTKQKANFRNGHWWVHNTYAEWREAFPWIPERTLKRIMAKLEGRGTLPQILVAEQPDGPDRRKWYRIDYDALEKFVAAREVSAASTTDDGASPLGEREGLEHSSSPSTGQNGPVQGPDAQRAKMASSPSTGQNGPIEEATLAPSSMSLDLPPPQTTTPSNGSPSAPIPAGLDQYKHGGGDAVSPVKPKPTSGTPAEGPTVGQLRDAVQRAGLPWQLLETLIPEALATLAVQTPTRVRDPLAWCVGYVTRRAAPLIADANRRATDERRRTDPRLSWIYEAAELVAAGEESTAHALLTRHGFDEDRATLIVDLQWSPAKVIEHLHLDIPQQEQRTQPSEASTEHLIDSEV